MVARRHGPAVRRNRMRRLLREAFRLNRSALSVPCDIVIVPRSGWRTLSLAAVEPAMRRALRRIESEFANG